MDQKNNLTGYFSLLKAALFFLVIVPLSSLAQLRVTDTLSNQQLAQKLVGSGVTISNVTVNCPTGPDGASHGFFEASNANLNLSDGLLMTSGAISNAVGPNDATLGSTDNGAPGDPQLDAIVTPQTTNDACVFEFDIEPLGDTLQFNYSLGSEEYPEFVCSDFNDVFGFFISGPNPNGGTYNQKNIATIPNTSIPVAINSVNNGSPGGSNPPSSCISLNYSQYYVDNGTGNTAPQNTDSTAVRYDGFTDGLFVKENVVPCKTYHLKLAVADVSDNIYDTGVFLEAESIVSTDVNLSSGTVSGNLLNNAIEGCLDGFFRFTLDNPLPDTNVVSFNIGGTATEGTDYASIPDSIVFPPGDTVQEITIDAFSDGITEPIEDVALFLINECNNQPYDTANVFIQDSVGLSTGLPDTVTICRGGAVQFDASGGVFYNWSPSQGLSSTTGSTPVASPDSSMTYVVSTEVGFCFVRDSTFVKVVEADFSLDLQPDTVTACFNEPVQLSPILQPSYDYDFQWSPVGGLQDSNMVNDSLPVAEPDSTTSFTVQVTSDSSNCTLIDTQTVEISGQAPLIDIQADKNNVCPGDSVAIDANILPLSCGPTVSGCQTQPKIQQHGSSSSQGNGTPFNGDDEDGRYQILLTPSQLNNAGISTGTIVQLFFDVNTQNSTGQYENFTIKMGCTNQDDLSQSSWMNNLTTVFTPKSVTTNAGFTNQFSLDTPYDWDGTSNLVIEVCYDNPNGSAPGGVDFLNSNNVGYNATLVASSNATSGCSLPVNAAQTYQEIPNLRFRVCEPPTKNYTYNWTPTTGLTKPDSLETEAIIDSSITYELFVDDGQCTNTGNITLNIDTSYDVQIDPGDTVLCTDGADSLKLNATVTGNPPSQALECGANGTTCSTQPTTTQIGQGTTQVTSETPYKGFWDDNRVQYLIRASELQAQGLSSGTITEIAWNVVVKNSLSTFTYEDFTIKMGCTSLNALPTNQFASTSLTNVYGPTNYITTTGVNTHSLNNSYDWDGTSNLIIEVCFNLPAGQLDDNDEVLATNTSFNSVLYDQAFNSTNLNGCTDLTNPISSTSRPNFQFTFCKAPEGEESFQWMPANQVSNDTIANPWAYVDLTSNSEFVVAYTPPNGCTKYDTINIPTQEFNNTISDDTSICTSDNVQLSASGEANTFTWLPDATLSCTNCPNPVANPDTVTTYKVLLQDTSNGCEQLKSVTVSFQTPQITFINSPGLLCPNGSDSLFVEDAGASYLWSNQDSGSGIEITQPGTYS
ncbi:MAG: hypothetical protein BRD50_01460, partial [Bacteroidetes bacterium SW_11_45_7]